MKREPCSARWRRRGLLFVVLLFCVPVSGCGLIMDEFTWLDRLPPPSPSAADGVSGP